MQVRKGTYVLFMHFSKTVDVTVGALGTVRLRRGSYCYVGSALAGLDQRLSRHLSREKSLKWHIDYLTTVCERMYAYESSGDYIEECELARIVEGNGGIPRFKGFGCSDCDCFSHLFYVNTRILIPILREKRLKVFSMNRRNFRPKSTDISGDRSAFSPS